MFSAINQKFPDGAGEATSASPSSSEMENFFSTEVVEELAFIGVNMLDTGNMATLQNVRNERVLERSVSFEWLEINPYPETNSVEMAFAPVELIVTLSRLDECEQSALEQLRP